MGMVSFAETVFELYVDHNVLKHICATKRVVDFKTMASSTFEDTGNQLESEFHDSLDAEGSNTVRPSSPTVQAMQVEVSGDGVGYPQGSLLPAPVVGASSPAGDVETARPGGSPG